MVIDARNVSSEACCCARAGGRNSSRKALAEESFHRSSPTRITLSSLTHDSGDLASIFPTPGAFQQRGAFREVGQGLLHSWDLLWVERRRGDPVLPYAYELSGEKSQMSKAQPSQKSIASKVLEHPCQ